MKAADAQSAESLVVRRADVSALYRDNEAFTGCGIYFHFECLVFFFIPRDECHKAGSTMEENQSCRFYYGKRCVFKKLTSQ